MIRAYASIWELGNFRIRSALMLSYPNLDSEKVNNLSSVTFLHLWWWEYSNWDHFDNKLAL